MKKINFNDFEKNTKKDKIYLFFYSIMTVLCLAALCLNLAVVIINPADYTSIAFLCVFGILLFFCLYLLINYLLIPKTVITLNYDDETITINKRLGKPETIKLKDINEVKTVDKKMFFNVMNLGSIYLITNTKTYHAKYLISPKYLSLTLNIYIATAKEGDKNA